MNRVFICVLAVLLTGCATQRIVQDYQRDSVAVIVRDSLVLRDSVVLVEIPKGSDKAVLLDTDTSRLETDIAEAVAYVAEGKLHHSLRNKSEALLPITIRVPSKIHIEKEVILQAYKTTEIEYVEKELSKWQRFLQTLGWAVIIALSAFVVVKMIRFFS